MSSNALRKKLDDDRQVSHLEEVRKVGEILETSKTEVATTPSERVPSAWYDLSCRLDTIRAVTQSFPDAVNFICRDFEGSEEERRYRLNQMAGLADAICTLLNVAMEDAELLEQQLISRDW
jgi:hypothetical protein